MPIVYFVGSTLDDVIREAVAEIIARGEPIKPKKGEATEISGVLLEITNARARLSRTETRGRIFSALGELCWYLAGSKDESFITYYIKNYKDSAEQGEIFGGYGPRLFNWRGVNQVSNVIDILKRKRDSRQAVIQLFDALDINEKHEDVPCTCTMQFMLRQGKLHLITNMRSNDIHLGMPHDVFCFTMLQEMVARSLSVELGTYKHAVGSLHLYVRDEGAARRFLKEGWQATKPTMLPMPEGDPWPCRAILCEAELAIRNGRTFDDDLLTDIDPYWADLIRLLAVFKAKTSKDVESARLIRSKMSSSFYYPYIDRVVRQLVASKPSNPSGS